MMNRIGLLACLCLALSASLAALFAQQPSAKPKPPKRRVLFAVWKYDAENVQMDPVAILDSGKYLSPPLDGDARPATVKQFIGKYFQPGTTYRLLFGGGEAGTVKVRKYLEPGCVGTAASVEVETSAKLGGQVAALATDDPELGRRAGSRRPPSPDERSAALGIARKAFLKNKVSSTLVAKMQTVNLTATDLDGDGREELIGSFTVDIDAQQGTAAALFLILEPQSTGFRAGSTWFYQGGSESENQIRNLVDQLDIDGDGMAEVVTVTTYYEANTYMIYKKIKGTWRVVYQGGGGGC